MLNWKIQKCYLLINASLTQWPEYSPCKRVVLGSNPRWGLSSIKLQMSLISQTDRQMVIEALEYYVQKLKDDDCSDASITAFQTLLNWIILEHFKNEN
jgi:hypothetical protein